MNLESIKPFLDFVINWYWLPLLIFYCGIIGAILIENRNPTKTVAWILVIIFLPVVGVILYYFFGQKFVKVKKIKRINAQQNRRLEKKWKELDPIMESYILDIHQKIGDFSKVFKLMKKERLSLPTLHNDIQLLINGEVKFDSLVCDLKNATHSIHLEYYIFEFDEIGKKIIDILEHKAQQGVKVRLLVDSFGSPNIVKYFQKNRNSKIEFHPFLPVTFTSLANSNYRNHRKICIIDSKIGYVGGINISDRYINKLGSLNTTYWRDTSIRIMGSAINLLQISFWNSWNQTDGETFLLEDGYLNLASDNLKKMGTAGIGFVSSDPASEGPYNMEALLIAIGEANEKIQLCTPYYIPSEELERALIVAAASGVEVELMIPQVSDSSLLQHASFSFLKPLLERGVKVYLYKKGFLHAKTATFDDKLAFVGTVNLDTRSFYINYEIAAVVSDSAIAIELNSQFELDKQSSELLTLEAWKNRSAWRKAIESLCRLLAPIL